MKLWDLRKQPTDVLWRHRNHNNSQPQKKKIQENILDLQNSAEFYFAKLCSIRVWMLMRADLQ